MGIRINRRNFLGLTGLMASAMVPAASGLCSAATYASALGKCDIDCDVVIIGAGLAGLTAARKLTASNVNVVVLEAQDRVGGRTLTINPDSTFIDHGGQWVSPGQDQLMTLASELGVSLFDTWHTGATVDWRDGVREIYSGAYPSYWSDADKNAAADAVDTLEALADTFPLEEPWTAPNANLWDFETLDQWLAAHVDSALARGVVKRGILGVFDSGPGPLSFLAGLFVARSAQDLIRHFKPNGIDQRFDGGAQQICMKMAQALGNKVFLGAWVSQIKQGPDGVQAIAGDLLVNAKHAVITLPPTIAGRLRYEPALSAARDHLTESTPMGWVIKAHCIYSSRFWLDQGLSGAVTSNQGAIRTTADNSPPSGSPAILVGFIEGAAARRLAAVPLQERMNAALADFTRYFGEQAASPDAYYEYSWGDDAFCRGAYGGYWTQGLWTTYGRQLRTPMGRLHWAGTETAPDWNGKMEGAVRSGNAVADEVLAAL
jgi:monoamine oxidase